MPEVIHCSFDIPCPEKILWWIISIATIGALITGVMMLQAARFALNTEGLRVSQQKLHRLGSASKLLSAFNDMDDSCRRSLRRGLLINFAFMFSLYGLMISISILTYGNDNIDESWKRVLAILCWLPGLTWLMDIVENGLTLISLGIFESKQVVSKPLVLITAIASWVKWLSGLGWLLIMLSILVTELVRHL